MKPLRALPLVLALLAISTPRAAAQDPQLTVTSPAAEGGEPPAFKGTREADLRRAAGAALRPRGGPSAGPPCGAGWPRWRRPHSAGARRARWTSCAPAPGW